MVLLTLFFVFFLVAVSNAQECVDNTFQCGVGNTVQQCSFQKWITIATCSVGTKCLPNDYECIPLDQYDSLYSLLNSKTTETPFVTSTTSTMSLSTVCNSTLTATSTPTLVGVPSFECSVENSFQCANNGVEQCAFGKWVHLADCPSGTTCMPNDYECIPNDLFSTFFSLINGCSETVTSTVTKVVIETATSNTSCTHM